MPSVPRSGFQDKTTQDTAALGSVREPVSYENLDSGIVVWSPHVQTHVCVHLHTSPRHGYPGVVNEFQPHGDHLGSVPVISGDLTVLKIQRAQTGQHKRDTDTQSDSKDSQRAPPQGSPAPSEACMEMGGGC